MPGAVCRISMRCWNYKGEKTIVGDLFNSDCKIQMLTLIKASNKKTSEKVAKKGGEIKVAKNVTKKTQENKIVKNC